MNEKEAKDFLNLTYDYIKNRYEKDESFSKSVLVTNGTVKEVDNVIGKYLIQINPYDKEESWIWCFPIVSTQTFSVNDLVFLIYWGDLTNAKILCLNR